MFINLAAENDIINETFTGRTNELSHLLSVIKTSQKPILVVGPRGIGKTAFLKMYQAISEYDYGGTSFISGQSLLSATALLPYILYRISADNHLSFNDPNAAHKYLKSLETTSKRYLVIIDDAHAIIPGDLIQSLNKLGTNVSVILSSVYNIGNIGNYHILQLGTFSQSEMVELLHKRIRKYGVNRKELNQYLEQISILGVEYSELSPRFILQTFDYYSKGMDLRDALANVRRQYFESASHLIITEDAGRFSVLPAVEQSTFGLITSNHSLLIGVPYVVIGNIRYHWKKEISEFEAMLNNLNTPEEAYQEYFERHPHYLKGIDYKDIFPHVVLEREQDKSNLIPDFLLQPLSSDFVDVLDLKLPTEKLVVGRENRKRLSQSVHDAVAQVREYRDYFENNNYREKLFRRYGVTSYRPKTMIVIGRRQADVTEEKLRQITTDIPSHLTIITYDDLYDKMKRMAEIYKV